MAQNLYNQGFYSLFEMLGINSSATLQAYITDVLQFDQTQQLDLRDVRWNTRMSKRNKWKQLLLEKQLVVMSTYADKDSPAIPIGTSGISEASGSIPTLKSIFRFDEEDYRTMMEYADSTFNPNSVGSGYKDVINEVLFPKLDALLRGNETSINYQISQFASNNGQLVLNKDNSPRGLKQTFTSAVPMDSTNTTFKKNVNNVVYMTEAKKWWLDTDGQKIIPNEAATCTPVQDVRNLVKELRNQGINPVLEVQEESFLADMAHPKWQDILARQAIGSPIKYLLDGGTNGNTTFQTAQEYAAMNIDQVKAAFIQVVNCPVIFNNKIVAVENLIYNVRPELQKLERTGFYAFNKNTYAARPFGEWATVESMMPLLPSSEYLSGTFFSGAGLMQYEYNPKSKTQEWWTEQSSIVVPSKPRDMYYLHIDKKA